MKRLIHTSDKYDELQGIEGMSRIGELPMRGSSFEIYVNTDDPGKIPHFHIRDKKDWTFFHTCIKIASPEYFHHDTKLDVLNSKEKKALDDFMHQPCKNRRYQDKLANMTNWDLVCLLWDINNSDVEIDEGIQQPDYNLL